MRRSVLLRLCGALTLAGAVHAAAPAAAPGFAWRGTKGWGWTTEQYLAEVPYLARFQMNFLMLCSTYGWDCRIRTYDDWVDCATSKPNHWWEPWSEEKRQGAAAIAKACQANGIEFCFSLNPNLDSERAVNTGDPENVERLWRHYAWAQSLGIHWFALSVDDATQGIDAASQCAVANEIFRRLRARDPAAQMIFCPTYYNGDGQADRPPPNAAGKARAKWQQPKAYFAVVSKQLHPEIRCFWTGAATFGRIATRTARSFRARCGHRLFIWDNYPVNDGKPTMHLGPVTGRDADLAAVADGYMSNPMCTQSELNRLPLATAAEYARDPAHYDPDRAIGHAIALVGSGPDQQSVLRDLVAAYPSFLGQRRGDSGWNGVREHFKALVRTPGAANYLEYLADLSNRFHDAFPDGFEAGKETLDEDRRFLARQFSTQFTE